MQAFRVDDMTCGHCVIPITKAVHVVDAGAKVEIDLARHLVMVNSTQADAQELSAAIAEAGYTPVAEQTATVAAKPAKAGGCCGCCS